MVHCLKKFYKSIWIREKELVRLLVSAMKVELMIGNKQIKIDGNDIIVDGSRYHGIPRLRSIVIDKDPVIIIGIQICCIKALIGIPDIQELADRKSGPRFYVQFGFY